MAHGCDKWGSRAFDSRDINARGKNSSISGEVFRGKKFTLKHPCLTARTAGVKREGGQREASIEGYKVYRSSLRGPSNQGYRTGLDFVLASHFQARSFLDDNAVGLTAGSTHLPSRYTPNIFVRLWVKHYRIASRSRQTNFLCYPRPHISTEGDLNMSKKKKNMYLPGYEPAFSRPTRLASYHCDSDHRHTASRVPKQGPPSQNDFYYTHAQRNKKPELQRQPLGLLNARPG